jgi:hypothetical protein
MEKIRFRDPGWKKFVFRLRNTENEIRYTSFRTGRNFFFILAVDFWRTTIKTSTVTHTYIWSGLLVLVYIECRVHLHTSMTV